MEKEKNKENSEEENDEEKKDENSQGLILFVEKKEINNDNEDKSEENKNYNDVNFWHVENIDDIKVDDILKELE